MLIFTRRPDFSLAICQTSFYFRGPKYTSGYVLCGIVLLTVNFRLQYVIRRWESPLFDRSHKKFQMMALGEGSTWITISEAGKATFSDNLSESYARLTQKYDARDLDSARQVVLGGDGHYFIQYANKARWLLPSGVSTEVDMDHNRRKVEVCALGISGAYVIQLSTGALFWDLKGHYTGLQHELEAVSESRKKLLVSPTPRVGINLLTVLLL